MRRRRYECFALGLLVLVCVSQFGWTMAPRAAQGTVWTIGMAWMMLATLGLIANAYRVWQVLAATAMGAAWQLMTIGCNMAWLWKPWPTEIDGDRCSAALDKPVGVPALLLALWLALRIYEGCRHG